jgi:hypothetical protein
MSTTEKLAKCLSDYIADYNSEDGMYGAKRYVQVFQEALAAHEADKQRESGDEREAFEAWVEREAGPGADQDNRAGWVACLNWQAGRASAQAVPAGMVLVSKRSIEALNEWAGDSQFYPNQPESKLVNPLMHRVMQETDAWLAAAPKGD